MFRQYDALSIWNNLGERAHILRVIIHCILSHEANELISIEKDVYE